MALDFSKLESLFLSTAVEDFNFLCTMLGHVGVDASPVNPPTAAEFERGLAFINYLYGKYGDHLHCRGFESFPPYRTSLPKEEVIPWLRQQIQAGHYYRKKLDYAIWFELDEEVIPPHYFEEFDAGYARTQEEWEREKKQKL